MELKDTKVELVKSSISVLQNEIDIINYLKSVEIFGEDDDNDLIESLSLAIKIMEAMIVNKFNDDDFSKCKTCSDYDIFEGCFGNSDDTSECYRPDKKSIISLSHKYEISVTDVINLINL